MASITIKDIAKAAGVSHPTVSKALNNAPGVSEATRRRILELAKQMNYVPNAAARSLANRQNRSIGLIWPSSEGLFFYHLCTTLQKETKKQDIDVFVSMSSPVQAIRNFNEHFIDYVVAWLGPTWVPTDEFVREKNAFKGQITIIGGGKTEDANIIEVDRVQGFYNITSYFAKLGHKKIAFVGEESDKKNGYLQGVLDNRLEYYPEYLLTAPNGYYNRPEARGELAVQFKQLWNSKKRPTALILDSQGSAFSMLSILSELKIQIPKDLSVLTYDDVPELSVYPVALDTCSPSLVELANIIIQDYETHYAAEGVSKKIISHQIVPEIIVRESSQKAK